MEIVDEIKWWEHKNTKGTGTFGINIGIQDIPIGRQPWTGDEFIFPEH